MRTQTTASRKSRSSRSNRKSVRTAPSTRVVKSSLTSTTLRRKPKMTTAIARELTMPDRVETPLGTLRFTDGFPDQATVQKVYDNLDFQRGVQAFLTAMPAASLSAMREGLRSIGVNNTSVALFETLLDSKSLFLTPNTESVYLAGWIDLKDGPVVVETPPNVLGLVDDFWFHYVTDMGNAGPDKGKGGKFVFLPPGYTGEEPDGCFVSRSATYGNWLLVRGFLVNGDPKPAVEAFKQRFRIYPLAQSADPPKTTFINASGVAFNTIHAMDFTFYQEVNQVVQEESNAAMDPETLGLLAAIGIEKGKRFAPDTRMKRILTDAAAVASATARTLLYRSREKAILLRPGSTWMSPAPTHTFEHDGIRLLDARSSFFFYATGITPAMMMKMVGVGSQYATAFTDSKGRPLDGSKQYHMHLPPDIPSKDFWSLVLYDNQTRSQLQTDERFPSISSQHPDVITNEDGSVDVYFGPTAPEGKESNWVQTWPGKGWNVILRLYGPLQAWFDRTWVPGGIEEITSRRRTH
jgi:hypothetical protein